MEFLLKPQSYVRNQHTFPCCWVTCRTTWQWWVQLCPSDNDPCSYYCSAPPAVSFGSITHYFSPKRNTLISTHVYSSFRQFSLEEEANSSLGTWETIRWTICTYAFAVYLFSADSLLRCCSALFGARRWKLHAHSAGDAALCANVSLGVFTWAKQLFMNDLKFKDGRGCSEEVVAKGKGHARKTGRGRAHRRPIGEQSVPCPVVRNSPATHGRPLGMAGVWVHLTCFTGIRDWCHGFHSFIFLIIVSGSKVYIYIFYYLEATCRKLFIKNISWLNI